MSANLSTFRTGVVLGFRATHRNHGVRALFGLFLLLGLIAPSLAAFGFREQPTLAVAGTLATASFACLFISAASGLLLAPDPPRTPGLNPLQNTPTSSSMLMLGIAHGAILPGLIAYLTILLAQFPYLSQYFSELAALTFHTYIWSIPLVLTGVVAGHTIPRPAAVLLAVAAPLTMALVSQLVSSLPSASPFSELLNHTPSLNVLFPTRDLILGALPTGSVIASLFAAVLCIAGILLIDLAFHRFRRLAL